MSIRVIRKLKCLIQFHSSILFSTVLIFSIFTSSSQCRYNDANNPLRIKSLLPKEYISISPSEKFWQDLRFNTSQFLSDESIAVPEGYYSCLWTPSLVFDSSTETQQIFSPMTVIIIDHNKVALRKSRFSSNVRCRMNLETKPMDKHSCHFKIRSFSNSVSKIQLQWLAEDSNPKDKLLDSRGNISVLYGNQFTPSLFHIKVGVIQEYNITWLNENYTILDVEFVFERRITTSIITVYIPSSLIVTLSWLQFWFDVEAVPGRISLGILSTLTIMTQTHTNYEETGNLVTAIDIWLLVCLIMVFLALMEYSVAYTMSHYQNNDKNLKPKNCFKKNFDPIFHKSNNKVISFDNNKTNKSCPLRPNDNWQEHENRELPIMSLREFDESTQIIVKSLSEIHDKLEDKFKYPRDLNSIDYYSRFVFPLAFVLFALFYWIVLIYVLMAK